MNYQIPIIFLSLILFSCDNDEGEKDLPTQVIFNYNGQEVSYDVIKKEYHKNANGEPLETPITKLWLDRNLGAERKAIELNDSLAAGDLFQWGRLDDGHQVVTSDTTYTLSQSITPGHNKYIASPLGPHDWLIDENNSLWLDAQSPNCPCPQDWRLPTIEELKMEMNSWDAPNMEAAFASDLKWVAGGNRDNHGTLRYREFWAFIWSSTAVENRSANLLWIVASDTTEAITSPRIFSASVRCIMDD